jgi:hypothetical protein
MSQNVQETDIASTHRALYCFRQVYENKKVNGVKVSGYGCKDELPLI